MSRERAKTQILLLLYNPPNVYLYVKVFQSVFFLSSTYFVCFVFRRKFIQITVRRLALHDICVQRTFRQTETEGESEREDMLNAFSDNVIQNNSE